MRPTISQPHSWEGDGDRGTGGGSCVGLPLVGLWQLTGAGVLVAGLAGWRVMP